MTEVWKSASDLIQAGAPNVWIIDPFTLDSELRTAEGVLQVTDRTLRLADAGIEFSLLDATNE